MAGEQVTGFTDNWSYLKTELNWLDRMLMTAVARQRKETKEVDRVAQSRADRATSHWWKGLISIDGTIANDEYRTPTKTSDSPKQSYQQQLETRIEASDRQGVRLALPMLRDRLQLTPFEKSLVLLSLAPEINRRYTRLYRYLQGEDATVKTDLPTIDLILRLLCRSDQEWQIARNRLMSDSPLLQYNLLNILSQSNNTALSYPLKLSNPLVTYLLAEKPTPEALEELLSSSMPPGFQPMLSSLVATVDWSMLILPEPVIQALQTLCQTIQWQSQVNAQWGTAQQQPPEFAGTLTLLVGAAGTGKTMAAAAIAHQLQTPLTQVDLAVIDPQDYGRLFQEIALGSPVVLLVKSAQYWFRRSALVSNIHLNQFLQERRRRTAITLFSATSWDTIRPYWQGQMDYCLSFPIPRNSDRLRLWQQAFPPQIALAPDVDWDWLAQRVKVSGGEIGAIARTAAIYLAASGETRLRMAHLLQALNQHHR